MKHKQTRLDAGARGELEPEPGPLVFEARGEAEPEPEPRGELLPRRKLAISLVGSAMLAEVRLKLPPRVEGGGGAMLPSLGTRVAKHGRASLLLGSRLRCTGEKAESAAYEVSPSSPLIWPSRGRVGGELKVGTRA